VALDYKTHDFIVRFGGWLILGGLLAWVWGEGIGPLVGGILTMLVLAGVANRVSRDMNQR
jgi:hypothetical protein